MAVYSLDPIDNPQWEELVQRHPRASIFHTTGWLRALHRVYGYKPVVYTTSAPGATLENGIVFCDVQSWLTGRRLVSLPFADHCDPLVESATEVREILDSINRTLQEKSLRYIEMRPQSAELLAGHGIQIRDFFCFHSLRLNAPLDKLFHNCSKNCVQRRIRRAASEPLSYEEGRSDEVLKKFYHLMVMTRRRQNLPPQPMEWFRQLAAHLGDRVLICVLSLRNEPVASIITLRHGATLVYKYGGSDARYHHLGCMPFLLWKAIEAAKQRGLECVDFGRSDPSNQGLIRFKDHFGTSRSILAYARICAPHTPRTAGMPSVQSARRVFAHVPGGLLTIAGRLLYRHIG